MPFDFVRSTEALAAHGTAVRLLSSVDPHVHLEVSHLREALPTDLAAERLFPRVAALVLLQPARRAAALSANAAPVWLLPRVYLNVHVQVANVAERLAANLAAKRRHVALDRRFLMRAVHSVGTLGAHVGGLSSVDCSYVSLGTNHLSSVLRANNVNVVFIRAVWVDWCERLGAAVGGRRTSVGSSAFDLHMPRGASRNGFPIPVLQPLTLGKVGCVGGFLGKFTCNTWGCEHVLRCAAGAMAVELILYLVRAEIPLVLNLNGDALFVTHAGTPLPPWMLSIFFIQKAHGWTIWTSRNS